MSKCLIRLQQDVIDEDMRTMLPEVVNQILSCMTFEEAQRFLGRLGAVRARMIYEKKGDKENEGQSGQEN